MPNDAHKHRFTREGFSRIWPGHMSKGTRHFVALALRAKFPTTPPVKTGFWHNMFNPHNHSMRGVNRSLRRLALYPHLVRTDQ